MGAEPPAEPTTTSPAPAPAPTPAPAPAPADPAPAPADADPETVDALPAWAQKRIRDLQGEAVRARTTAKQNAADEARKALLADMQKALGLADDADDVSSPEKMKQLLADAANDRKQAQIELAVTRQAAKLGADLDALMDSRTVTTKLGKLDPADQDFTDSVADVIRTAIEANPRLAVAQSTPTAGRSGTEITGQGGTGSAPKTWDDIEKLARQRRR